MKKSKLLLLAVLSLSILNFSCLVDDEEDTSLAESPYVVGFNSNQALLSYFEDLGPIEAEFPINLLGGQEGYLNGDIKVNYSIDPSSTAVEGQEFDFVDTSGSVTIPSGGSFAMFPLIVNTGGLDPSEPTILKLNLDSTSGANSVISALGKSLEITFVGCQSELNLYNYSVIVTRGDGAQWNHGVQDIRFEAANTFKTRTTGSWADGTLAPPDQGYVFTDVCGDLNVADQNLMDYYSNQVYGVNALGPDGSVDSVTGDFEVEYTITFDAGNNNYVHSYTRL